MKPEGRLAISLEKAKALFVELVANVPQDQWDARLAELAGGDEGLRRKVKRILAAHRDAGSFLESPAPALGATVKPDEVKKRQAERAKYAGIAPPPREKE